MVTFSPHHYMCNTVIDLLKSPNAGTARTSLIVTIGPSSRHFSETSSTIMFGQRVSVDWSIFHCSLSLSLSLHNRSICKILRSVYVDEFLLTFPIPICAKLASTVWNLFL